MKNNCSVSKHNWARHWACPSGSTVAFKIFRFMRITPQPSLPRLSAVLSQHYVRRTVSRIGDIAPSGRARRWRSSLIPCALEMNSLPRGQAPVENCFCNVIELCRNQIKMMSCCSVSPYGKLDGLRSRSFFSTLLVVPHG